MLLKRKNVKLKIFFLNILYLILLPVILLLCFIIPKKRKRIIWGPVPIINNKYWSEAVKEAGYDSQTLMFEYYAINQKDDFDLYYDELVPRWIPNNNIRTAFSFICAFYYIIHNASVIVMPLSGGPFMYTFLHRIEAQLFKFAGVKTILIPYGSDAYQYSKVIDLSLRNGLLLSYPDRARSEASIQRRVQYWVKHADIMLTGIMIDGIGRWDITKPSVLMINTNLWQSKIKYSMNDGRNGPVKIMHTPNHRGFKGTEFLINAVDELKKDGLHIELVLLEKVPNHKVQELMQEVDILVEQLILGYAMSALEGMASGLPVISNLENEPYTRVFRRYAYLNECPILSASPETIKENLRILITHPELRKELGEASRLYVEKYHSYKTAQYLFGSIFKVILEGEDIDLMNLFHPIKSDYVHATPKVCHPLKENKIRREIGQK